MTEALHVFAAQRLEFGPFCLSPHERLLTRHGEPIELGGRSFDLLAALVQQPGRVISKRELLKRVWPDVVVEDGSLRFHMASLRKLLGDGEAGMRYISTQIGVGYAFVAPVRRLPLTSGAPTAVTEVSSQTAEMQAGVARLLPARLPRVIGRESDIRLLAERIADTQLFSIVGAAGVGKTTLAVELAHGMLPHFADKVYFADLALLQDPGLVGSAIAGALGIPVQTDDPLKVVLGHLRDQKLLLILDNCEHLIDAVSLIVERISDAAPQARILTTSREPLRVRHEHIHWLGALAYPEDIADLSQQDITAYSAVALFIARATAANSAFIVDEAAARMIGEICGRLDGMALAIELTAVRAATHGLQETAAQLGARFSLGWAGRRTAQPRQQTLHATLNWSYGLLSETERRTLERLSIFCAPFTIAAALEVVADDTLSPDAAARALDELAAKSLMSRGHLGDANFYRLLEFTRAYASEKLSARGPEEANALAARHAAFFLSQLEMVTAAGGTYMGRPPRYAVQIGNMRAALEWCFGPGGDLPTGVALAAASAQAFLNLSLFAECRSWCVRALAHLGQQRGSAAELELQAALGLSLTFTRGNGEAAETALRRALEVAVAQQDHWNQLRLLGRLHIFHERIGLFEIARGWADMAVEVAAIMGDPEAAAVAASLSGVSHHLAGNQTLARRDLELAMRQSARSARARAIYYGFDHRNRSGIALARTLWLQGYADQARLTAAQTLHEADGLKDPITQCIALIWALSIDFWVGDLDAAKTHLAIFSHAAEINEFGPYIAASGGFRGELSIELGQSGEALGWIEESLARLHAARYELLTTAFSAALVRGLALSGRHGEALDVIGLAIDRCNANGELLAMPELLRIKAYVIRHCAGDDAEVETLLLESLSCSRAQGARGWELRAAIDIAQLWRSQNRMDEAHALLRTLRDGFTEGADTADLRAADLLLTTFGGGDATAQRP